MRVSGWMYLVEQALGSALLLRAIGISAGLSPPRRLRILGLSVLLSLTTLAAMALPLALRLLLIPVTAASSMAVWPDAPARLRLRMALAGLAMPVGLTGTLRLLAPLRLPGLLMLIIGCGGLLAAVSLSVRTGSAPRCAAVHLRVGVRRTSLVALVDTGNLLRDGVTGLPVIVISRRAASRLLTLPATGALLPGMRLMSIRTVSGTGLMTILRPDSVCIRSDGGWRQVQALIGFMADGYEGFQALVPASLVASWLHQPRKAVSQGG